MIPVSTLPITPLETVRELNYDHHRRMTELHFQQVNEGLNKTIRATDTLSYRSLLRFIPKDRQKVLELGSASGGQWDILREWAPEGKLYGIDLFEPSVLDARARGLPIEVGFVENMTMFPAESFDLVCSRHVMEHLGDVHKGIEEIKRVLRRGGFSAHVTPDIPGDNEPAHLNKFPLAVWKGLWLEHRFRLAFATKLPFHGGEVHIVAQLL